MNRSPSEDHIAFGPVTPWERGTFSRLPHRSEPEPPVPVREKTRPSRSNSIKAPRPTQRSVTQRSDGSRHRGTPPPPDGRNRAQGSLSSAQSTPRPYETSFHGVPPTLQSSPSPPPCYTKALPGTPPESLDEKSFSSKEDTSMSPSSKKSVKVFPGTMATRNARSIKSASTQHRRKKQQQGQQKPVKKAGGWKVVFRQIFTKSPVDETQFERIEGRHWTED